MLGQLHVRIDWKTTLIKRITQDPDISRKINFLRPHYLSLVGSAALYSSSVLCLFNLLEFPPKIVNKNTGNLNSIFHFFLSIEDCDDQFDTCPEMAKNDYCTKYPDLMKIQCKKSCHFCGRWYVFAI